MVTNVNYVELLTAYSCVMTVLELICHSVSIISVSGAQAQTCDAWDWIQCSSGLYNCEVVCEADLTAASCSSCLGDSYSNCVYCIPSSTAPNLTQSDLGTYHVNR